MSVIAPLENKFLTVKEACDNFGISRRTLYNWFEKFEIGTKKRGNKLMIDQMDLMKAKQENDTGNGYENRREIQDKFDKSYDLLKSALTTLQDELRSKNRTIEEYSIARTNSLLLQEAKTIEQNSIKKGRRYRVGFYMMTALSFILLVALWSAVIVRFVLNI